MNKQKQTNSGWTNWHTRAVFNHIANIELWYKCCMQSPTPEGLSLFVDMVMGDRDSESGYIDGIEPHQVNYEEIRDALQPE